MWWDGGFSRCVLGADLASNWKIEWCESAVVRNLVSTVMFAWVDLRRVPRWFFLVRAFGFSD